MTDIAKKLELVFCTNIVIKEELIQKLIVGDVLKTKMINVAGQMSIQFEKESDESNRIIKRYETCIGNEKYKNYVLKRVFETNIKENITSDKVEFCK